MDLKENFAVISGEVPPSIKQKLDDITEISKDRYKDIKKGYHEWVDTLDNKRLQSLIDEVRSDSSILDGIHAKFPNSSITPITDVDEIYWSVSPADAKASDRLLVDCHYDTPFALLPTGGVVFYRVLIGCNENNDIITHFPAENIDVKMSTGDYHGLDYNQDYHCVTGTIPSGKIRVLLKLHYAVVPKGSEDWKETTISWNRWWAVFSRNTMNSTSNPKNMYDQVLSYIFGYLRFIYLNIRYIIVFILIVIIAYYYRNNFKYLRRKR